MQHSEEVKTFFEKSHFQNVQVIALIFTLICDSRKLTQNTFEREIRVDLVKTLNGNSKTALVSIRSSISMFYNGVNRENARFHLGVSCNFKLFKSNFRMYFDGGRAFIGWLKILEQNRQPK